MRCRLDVPLTPYFNEFKRKLKGKINFHVIYFSNLKAFEAKLSLFHKHVSRNIVSALHLQKSLSHSVRQTDYTGFNPTVAQSKTNIHLSLYDVSSICFRLCKVIPREVSNKEIQGGSNMTGTDLYVNKPHCAAAVRP